LHLLVRASNGLQRSVEGLSPGGFMSEEKCFSIYRSTRGPVMSSSGSGSVNKGGRPKKQRECLSLPIARRCGPCTKGPKKDGWYRGSCRGPRSAGDQPEEPEQPIAVADRVQDRTILSRSGTKYEPRYEPQSELRNRQLEKLLHQQKSFHPGKWETCNLAHSFALTPLYRNSFEFRNRRSSSGHFEKFTRVEFVSEYFFTKRCLASTT
jgi:hypothetical protein